MKDAPKKEHLLFGSTLLSLVPHFYCIPRRPYQLYPKTNMQPIHVCSHSLSLVRTMASLLDCFDSLSDKIVLLLPVLITKVWSIEEPEIGF